MNITKEIQKIQRLQKLRNKYADKSDYYGGKKIECDEIYDKITDKINKIVEKVNDSQNDDCIRVTVDAD